MDCDGSREDLLDVLYEEASPDVRSRVDAHLAACSACRDEFGAFGRLRRDLASWSVPEPRRVSGGRAPLARRFVAAAAVLILAVGAAFGLSGSELRYEQGRLFLRVGPPAAAEEGWREALARGESRHREELTALRTRIAQAEGRGPLESGGGFAQLTQMIRDSEDRQGRRLEAGLARVESRTAAQRRYDVARMTAGLSYLEGKTGRHVARTTELMGYLLEASQKRGER